MMKTNDSGQLAMTSMKPETMSRELLQKIEDLISNQSLGVLATADKDGHPYACLIAFAGNTDNSELYFVTPRATRKFANLTHEPRVAILINNSVNRPEDFHEALAVTVLGTARVLDGADIEQVLPVYLSRHPYLKQFAQSPSCAVFAVTVKGFTMVEQFQNVSDLELDHDVDADS